MTKFIHSNDIRTLLAELIKRKDTTVIAPVSEDTDDVLLAPASNINQINFHAALPTTSPKRFLFKHSETLFEVKNNNAKVPNHKNKLVFFGIPPCDMVAVNSLKRFFYDTIVDPYFSEKYENSIFITIACHKECSKQSFCLSMNTGPFIADGFDVQLYTVANGFLAESSSKKGKAFLKNKYFQDTEKELRPIKESIIRNFTIKIDYEKAYNILKNNKVEDSVWQNMVAERCQQCSGCSAQCPTCTCFSVNDRSNERYRFYDSCYFGSFTKLAENQNPLPVIDTFKRFFMHKLVNSKDRYGSPDCVGCGRCIDACPGNISILKFMQRLTK